MANFYEIRANLGGFSEGRELLRNWDIERTSLSEMIDSLNQIIDDYDAKRDDIRSDNAIERRQIYFMGLISEPQTVAYMQDILSKKYKEALASYEEFAEYPQFRRILDKFFLKPKPELFAPYMTDTGIVRVNIRAAEVVGYPEELGEAVTLAREQMKQWTQENAVNDRAKKMGGTELYGDEATLVWYIKLYRTARKGKVYWSWRKKRGSDEKTKVYHQELTAYYRAFYKEYMRKRIEEMNERAPIWYLLEYGNLSASLSSDKGGKGDPEWQPTHFISETEIALADYLMSAVLSYRVDEELTRDRRQLMMDYFEIMRKCRESRDDIQEILDEQERGITDLGEIDKESRFVFNSVEDIVHDISDNKSFEDKVRIKQIIAVRQILLGEVPSSGKVYIASKGGEEARVSAKKAIKELEEDPEGKRILEEMRKLPREVQKARLAADKLKWANLRAEEQKRKR